MKAVRNLKRGETVAVKWHDACAFSQVEEITPEIYVTRKRTIGCFYGCLEDPDSEMQYLILVTEETDGKPTEGNAIPLSCIESISEPLEKAGVKRSLKAEKARFAVKLLEDVRKVYIHDHGIRDEN